MKKSLMKKYINFLEMHKVRLGFADYKIFIKDETNYDSEFIATADPNWIERTLTITVYKDFLERKDWEETLIHELIHAALARIYKEAEEKSWKIRYYEEEKMVNRFTDTYLELWRLKK